MKVGLYKSYDNFPFGHKPQNPKRFFDPSMFANLERIAWGETKNSNPAKTDVFSAMILQGLWRLEIRAMAHVCLIEPRPSGGPKTISKEIWVQITTEPKEDKSGMPKVVKKGVPQVVHLWTGNNIPGNPDGFLFQKFNSESGIAPVFWSNFFLAKLREVKDEAQREMIEVSERIRNYSIIP